MSDRILTITICESDRFKKDLKKLLSKYDSARKDIQSLIDRLAAGETPGDRVSGDKYPVYKVIVKNSDTRKGKSGDNRVAYYITTPTAILLATIYARSEREQISDSLAERLCQREIEYIIRQYELAAERQEREIDLQTSSG
jgi:mRNA-degrading endonuclease RelE of RelBE toxin-antitoxin system